MDQRSKRGFFVAIRERTGRNQVRVAALKLDVHDEHAAAARLVGDELQLEAVQDLLDIPGELQKGAVYPDDRPHSEVIIVDKFERTALYFLRALEVQQIEKRCTGSYGLNPSSRRCCSGAARPLGRCDWAS